jgi:hypothetical protein
VNESGGFMDKMFDSPSGCCPPFNPEPWDEKEHLWQDKLFIKDHVRSFLHIPLNFGKVMTRNMEKIAKAQALTPDPLMLSDEKSKWGADIYIAVTKDIPDSTMSRISGRFLTKAFEGPYRNIRAWIREMETFVRSKKVTTKKLYFFYTTCPKCAKFYGKNYVVIVAQID